MCVFDGAEVYMRAVRGQSVILSRNEIAVVRICMCSVCRRFVYDAFAKCMNLKGI